LLRFLDSTGSSKHAFGIKQDIAHAHTTELQALTLKKEAYTGMA
jgi:hypothetical protein